jgi:hypothetical protein
MDSYDREIQKELKRQYPENRWLVKLARTGKLLWDWWLLIFLVVCIAIAIINFVESM